MRGPSRLRPRRPPPPPATSVTLSTAVGPPTTTVSLTGVGFGSNELVDLYFGLTDVALVSTNASGAFTYNGFVVPASAQPGASWISAEGRHSGAGAQASFLVRTDWTQFGYKASGGRYNAYENTLDLNSVGGLGLAWSYTSGSPVESAVAVADGVAYIWATAASLTRGRRDNRGSEMD